VAPIRACYTAAPHVASAKARVVPRVVLAVDSLAQTASGIARVARLMARVIVDEAAHGRIEAEALVLCSDEGADLGIKITAAGGSRPRFVAAIHRAALTSSHFVYDFTGIARAHPRVPGLARPYLTWMHGIEVWEAAEEKRLARARGARILLANSAYTVARARALHGGLEHAQVCWLSTESDEPAARQSAPRPPAIAILARLDDGGGYKGHRELIACWHEVVARVPGAKLQIVGDGPGRAVIEQWAAASPARADIELKGLVSEDELNRVLDGCTALAMPSRGEGFGLAYVEAMRHGVPVIGSVHDAAREVNVDGVTGFNVDLDRPGELSARVVQILSEPELARALGQGALQRWHEQMRYARFAERFRPLLRSLWGERS
jgi:phosphatidylinositol alpha-1,6-mannosyltransferase